MSTKPSKETISLLKRIAKTHNIDMVDIKATYNKLFESRAIQNLKVPNEIEREKHTVRVIVANLMAAQDRKDFTGNSVPVIMKIESKGGISDFKKQGSEEIGYRSELFVTMQDEDENINIAKLTLWNDACECHPDLIIGETYATSVVIGNRGSIWECSMNEPQEIEDSDVELTPISEIITENFTPISISDVENNISKDRSDPKLVEGVVVSNWAKVTTNNRDMGFLKIMGDISDEDESIVAKFSGDANCINSVSAGDLVYVLGQTTKAVLNDDGTEQYPIGMWGELIVPVIQVDRIEDSDENTDDEIDESDKDSSEKDISGSIGEW